MEYRVGGSLLNVIPENLTKELIIYYPDLKFRPRVYGYDISTSQKDFDMDISTLDNHEYSLEINFRGEKIQLLKLLESLKNVFSNLNLRFDIWYCLEDGDGNQIGEENIFFDNHTTSSGNEL